MLTSKKMQWQFAPDGLPPGKSVGGDLSILPDEEPEGDSRFRTITPGGNDDAEYYIEGEEPEGVVDDDPESPISDVRGKSREELLEVLAAERAKLKAASDASQPVSALQQTMAQMLEGLKPPKQEVQLGYRAVPQQAPRMSDAEFETYVNNLMLENPHKAQQEMMARSMEPILQTFASNQAQLSRELVLTNPATKAVYDKYGSEVEQVVAQTPVQTRLTNPRVYQEAIDTVKARHMEEYMAEGMEAKLAQMLEERLKSLGIDPTKTSQPAAYATPPATAARPASTAKRPTSIPRWVSEEADRQGIADVPWYYEHLKSKGRIK